MGTRLLLTEGGVAGHMAHLYDNGELTFAKIKEIFTAASNGEIEGTEKTDGQNLFISYNVNSSEARAARNKGNIKQGGMTAEQLASKFEGRGGLTEAFVESFTTFEKAVRSLDIQTQVGIFGENADIYYNAEIMDPRSPNVVNYDTKSLVIHQVGHGEYDKNTGNKTDRDVTENAKVLQAALEQMQQATAEDEYSVQVNAVRSLEALEDDIALHDAMEALGALQSSTGLSDKATINEFLVARLTPHVTQAVPDVDENIHKLILQRLLKAGPTFSQVVKGLEKDQKERIRAVIKNEKNLLKSAIAPLEQVIHDFSVEMLRGLQSAFILDNNKEIARLRKEVAAAIKGIEGSSHEGAIDLLKRQMSKLKHLDNVSTASEGFVFDYDGQTYKFTGNFAAINQILGLFKYGRGDIPAMVKEEEMDQRDTDRYYGTISEEGGAKADIALVPGAFKPPHRGHLAMVKWYTTVADRVLVWISPLPRTLPESGKEITLDMAKAVWDVYLKHEGISGVVTVEQAPMASPVGAAYKYIGETAQPGESVILGASDKPDPKSGIPDYERFKNASKYQGEGVTALYGKEYSVDHTMDEFTNPASGEAYRASDLRAVIEKQDLESLKQFLPNGLEDRAQEILKLVSPSKQKSESISKMIVDLIKENMEECNAMAGGGVVGVNLKVNKKPNKYNPWNEPEEDLDEFKDASAEYEMDLEDTVGIPRNEMPQIKSTDMQDFVQWLSTEKNVKAVEVSMMVDDLTPTQKKINIDKVKGMLANKTIDELANSKPILVTSDNHLVDGHHRWFGLYLDDPKNNILTIRVQATLEEFLKISQEYPKVSYKSMVDERLVNEILSDILQTEGYENFGGQTKVLKVGSVVLDIEDMELEPSKHGEERRFRHKQGGSGHKISKNAIISAVDRSLGLIMNDYANGEIANGEAFHIRMKGQSKQVPALNVVAALEMQKGPDTIKVITVMRKDDFKTDNFGGGSQKTYNVGA